MNLADLTAENVMTPRVQVTALDVQTTAEDVANATLATGLSRFPVYRGSLDTVVGTVHIKDVLALSAEERHGYPVSQLLRAPLLVPESLTVDRLLDRLSGKQTMAVVIDEYGGTAGVATLEDIVEEVVGEVRDEHDPHETPDLAPAGTDASGRRAVLGRRRSADRPAAPDRPAGAGRPVRDAGRADSDRAGPDPAGRGQSGAGRLAAGRGGRERTKGGPRTAAPPRGRR